MSTAHGLRKRILPASVETALRSAARPQRLVKHMHSAERQRELRRLDGFGKKVVFSVQ